MYFKPDLNPVGMKVNTRMVSENPQLSSFTQVPLDDKIGYLLIAAPST